MYTLGFQVVLVGKNLPATVGDKKTWVQSLGWKGPLKKGMATHSSILAWRIPLTEEPGGVQSKGSQEPVTMERLSAHTHTHIFEGGFLKAVQIIRNF